MAHTHLHTNNTPHSVAPAHARLMRLASYASVGVALLLLSGKAVAWWLSDSLAMFSSLTDSLFDVVVSVMNLIAVRYALKPADDDHRFGHTAIEDIMGLAQFVFIVASMVLIILQSIERLANPQPLTHELFGIVVSAASMLITIALVMFQTHVARVSGSLIIAADRMHYVGDILFNASVMLALFLTWKFGLYEADGVIAIIIAASVIISTFSIGRRAFDNLMGREMPDSEKQKIIDLLTALPEIRGYHNLRTRYMGMKPIIQMHIDIPDSLSFHEAHEVTEHVEAEILALFPGAEVIVHPDPVA
jgi:ferrous-iron efflux pump FieF